MIIQEAIRWARQQLSDSDTPQLDSEVLVAAVLMRSRTYLHTWPERLLSAEQLQQLGTWVAARQQGTPIAHLVGKREFWSLELLVNASTLIPRADTEVLVEVALNCCQREQAKVLDLGTGTGAIALALKSERSQWDITAVDKIPAAVALAKENSKALQLPIQVLQSHWFSAVSGETFDLIVSNPPYIDGQDPHLGRGDVRHEPHSALVAEQSGLADLQTICQAASDYLNPAGWLVLEHGWQQAEAVRQLLLGAGFEQVQTQRDYGNLERITYGQHVVR